MDPVRHPTIIAAHRGGAGLWPENSLLAFKNALQLGVVQIETDVHLSRDGELVIIHDATLERTTFGVGEVGMHDWDQLKAIELRGAEGECIPHIDDMFSVLVPSTVGLRLEIKTGVGGTRYPDIEEKILRCLRTRSLLCRTVVSSFDWQYLLTLRALEPGIRVIGLVKQETHDSLGGLAGVLDAAAASDVHEISLPVDLMTADSVDIARRAGIRFGVHAVRTEPQMRKALTSRVAAFTTDYPDVAIRLQAQLAHGTHE